MYEPGPGLFIFSFWVFDDLLKVLHRLFSFFELIYLPLALMFWIAELYCPGPGVF